MMIYGGVMDKIVEYKTPLDKKVEDIDKKIKEVSDYGHSLVNQQNLKSNNGVSNTEDELDEFFGIIDELAQLQDAKTDLHVESGKIKKEDAHYFL